MVKAYVAQKKSWLQSGWGKKNENECQWPVTLGNEWCHIGSVGGGDGDRVMLVAVALTHHDYFSYGISE